MLYFNDLFNQFEYTQDVLTVQAGRWRPVMLRPVMLTDLIKHNTSLQYDRLRSPDVLINFINQFECTYKVLTVPARRWRPVMLTDSIKQYTILSYDRSRSPYTSLVRTGSLSLPFGQTPWKSSRQRQWIAPQRILSRPRLTIIIIIINRVF